MDCVCLKLFPRTLIDCSWDIREILSVFHRKTAGPENGPGWNLFWLLPLILAQYLQHWIENLSIYMWTHAKLRGFFIFKMVKVHIRNLCTWIEILCSSLYHVFCLAIKALLTVMSLQLVVVLFMRLSKLAVGRLCSHLSCCSIFLLVSFFPLSPSFSSILQDFWSSGSEMFQFCFSLYLKKIF